jgi:hypothetical protein
MSVNSLLASCFVSTLKDESFFQQSKHSKDGKKSFRFMLGIQKKNPTRVKKIFVLGISQMISLYILVPYYLLFLPFSLSLLQSNALSTRKKTFFYLFIHIDWLKKIFAINDEKKKQNRILMLESQNSVNDFIAEIFFIFMKKL